MRDRPSILYDLQRLARLVHLLVILGKRLLLPRLRGVRPDLRVVGAELRALLEAMGITYVKLGQFLAMRFDILPEAVCHELARLFDAVPPLPSETVRAVLQREFSTTVETLFDQFDWTCIAAASVAQTHKAVTREGDVVAVKVQRPGIERMFAADIRNFRRAARLGDRLRLLGSQSLVGTVDEFEEYTAREMDFLIEGRTADKLRRLAGPSEDVPRVHWGLTTSRVLTMEFVAGHPLSRIIELIESGHEDQLEALVPGLNLERAVANLARACLRQLFVTGFFHADPHPGNIFLRDDGTVVFVDCGIFGQLSADRRETVASYIEYVALGNVALSYRSFVRLIESTDETDHEAMKRDVYDIMRRWHEASQRTDGPAGERHLGKYISEFIATMRRHNARMTFGMLLFWRALMTLDATALRFKGKFDLLVALREFFTEIRPTRAERLIAAVTDRRRVAALAAAVQAAPRPVALLGEELSQGRFQLRVRTGAGSRRRAGPAQARRLSFAIVSGSLVVLAARAPLGDVGQVAVGAAAVTLALFAVTSRSRA